jgi:hypothetical protein
MCKCVDVCKHTKLDARISWDENVRNKGQCPRWKCAHEEGLESEGKGIDVGNRRGFIRQDVTVPMVGMICNWLLGVVV